MYILTADWHLKQGEDYRFGIFDVLCGMSDRAEHLFVLGDVTDDKDRHPAELLDRIAEGFVRLARSFASVTVVIGNHDYAPGSVTSLRFLRMIEGVEVIEEPTVVMHGKFRFYCVPHANPADGSYARSIDRSDLMSSDFVLTHVPFSGSVSETGRQVSGVDPSVFDPFGGWIFAGDIHVPQIVDGRVVYTGAPYHIRFGDRFDPGVIVLSEDGSFERVSTASAFPARVVVEADADSLDVGQAKPGDSVKFRVRTRPSGKDDLEDIRRRVEALCEERGLVLRGIDFVIDRDWAISSGSVSKARSMIEIYESYCEANMLPDDLRRVGRAHVDRVSR